MGDDVGTVIFDFDSTLISCESLEYILSRQQSLDSARKEEIRKITQQGINGQIAFSDSLRKRLEIAAPSLSEVVQFGQHADRWLTPGMAELILRLQERRIDVWIISGAILETLLPLGRKLGIPEERIRGVQLLWNGRGEFAGIDESVPFCRSKVEGCHQLASSWTRPKVAVGDSMSDYRLYSEGLADDFVAFTQHYKCREVLENPVKEAADVQELTDMLWGILNG